MTRPATGDVLTVNGKTWTVVTFRSGADRAAAIARKMRASYMQHGDGYLVIRPVEIITPTAPTWHEAAPGDHPSMKAAMA